MRAHKKEVSFEEFIRFASFGAGMVLMLRAYLDDSQQGADAQSLHGFGGCIATEKQWIQFTKLWKRQVLEPFKIKRFHMTDCESGRGDFDGWPIEKRERIKKIALPLVRRWMKFGTCSILILSDYDSLTEGTNWKQHFYFKSAYQFCFFSALWSILQITKSNESIAVICDWKENVSGQAKQAFDDFKAYDERASRLVSIAYTDNISCPPLQAADVIVYEGTKGAFNHFFDPLRPTRKSLEVLDQWGTVDLGYHDRANLIAHMKRINAGQR